MSFENAVNQSNLNGKTTTANGMKARVSSGNEVVDFFYKAGAMRGQDITPLFNSAMSDDEELALRVSQWLRDVRGGAGERQHYRNILLQLEVANHPALPKLIAKTPELGRWDDLLIFKTDKYKKIAFDTILAGLANVETAGLVAKWLPREKSAKGGVARELREYMELTPKQYRKLLVSLTNVVETKMCAKQWDEINFSQVPSLAGSRYRKAFLKNAKTSFETYVQKLVSKDATVKVNAGAVYPHQVVNQSIGRSDTVAKQFAQAQWDALPDYLADNKILAMIDTSGSMQTSAGVGKGAQVSCMHVALSLGMYVATKTKGAFNGLYLTFSSNPVLRKINSTNVIDAYYEVMGANWGMATDVELAMQLVLDTAKKGKVSQDDMPKYILILSDMQFNGCTNYIGNPTAQKMFKKQFEDAGYEVPNIIYWNLKDYDNVPVKFDKAGTALVSGFSPSILKAVLSAKFDEAKTMTPKEVMLETIMDARYDL